MFGGCCFHMCEEAEVTGNHCGAALVCVSAKHFTVGPKMAGMRVVSASWQGPLDYHHHPPTKRLLFDSIPFYLTEHRRI